MKETKRLFDVKSASAIAIVLSLIAFLLSAQPAASQNQYTGGAQVDVTVNEVISVTLGAATVGFGSLNPGTTNTNAATGFPVGIVVKSSTNIVTNISTAANATDDPEGDFLNAGHAASPTILINNLTFSNSSAFTTELTYSTTFQGNSTFGDAANTTANWSSVACPCAGSDATGRNLYMRIDVPTGQQAETYHTHIAIKVSKA